ncbi:hypothetical protein HNO52_05145 [Billgrantia diversa]|uniref:hypothetical protein n=1 Tax=Halomonas sp. MCCC 1A13316 TaxID=2733487 RepID=UPI0018A45D7F|nr:hypothetical protein [Halomonas sp. MCCC 1A13316]QOR37961.1 hypothetical protein HNO52_05145 [Halomonas sp. MCCC 1A13316]
MYFVIERQHIGPKRQQDADSDLHCFEVLSQPARHVSSGEACLNDSCGEEWGIETYAHGEHPTAEAAEFFIRNYMADLGLEYREDEELKGEVVSRFYVGRYKTLGVRKTQEWLYGIDMSDTDADTTDEDIAEIVRTIQEGAHETGEEYCAATLEKAFKEHRLNCRDELGGKLTTSTR